MDIDTAIALDPDHVEGSFFLTNLHIFAAGIARHYLEHYEGALPHLIAARDQNPTAPCPHRLLIATCGMPGGAEWAALEYEAPGRTVTVEAMVAAGSLSNAAYRETFVMGSRAAGLPDFRGWGFRRLGPRSKSWCRNRRRRWRLGSR